MVIILIHEHHHEHLCEHQQQEQQHQHNIIMLKLIRIITIKIIIFFIIWIRIKVIIRISSSSWFESWGNDYEIAEKKVNFLDQCKSIIWVEFERVPMGRKKSINRFERHVRTKPLCGGKKSFSAKFLWIRRYDFLSRVMNRTAMNTSAKYWKKSERRLHLIQSLSLHWIEDGEHCLWWEQLAFIRGQAQGQVPQQQLIGAVERSVSLLAQKMQWRMRWS